MPGVHLRLQFADAQALNSAAARFAKSARKDAALTGRI